jgi:hypothetical protein
MLEVRVKQLEKETAEKEVTKEAAEKEAAGKEVAEKEAVETVAAEKEAAEKEDDKERKTSPGHQEAVTMTALSDFAESSIGSSVPFSSTICISTRSVYSSTSNT